MNIENKAVYRSLSSHEKQILELLDAEFPGSRDLAEQIKSCLVQTIDENGSLAFQVISSQRASVARRIPIEAEVEDVDGVMIHILLHVVDGKVAELEIYKDDSSSIIKKFDASDMRLVQLD